MCSYLSAIDESLSILKRALTIINIIVIIKIVITSMIVINFVVVGVDAHVLSYYQKLWRKDYVHGKTYEHVLTPN